MMRVMTRLLAIFGLYVIVLFRMAGGQGSSNSYTSFILELAGVTVLFVIAIAWVLTRKPRAKPSLDEPDE